LGVGAVLPGRNAGGWGLSVEVLDLGALATKEVIMILKHYRIRANRDAEAKRLRAEGYIVRLSSARNQLIHPMYMEEDRADLSPEECGFGNTIYSTHYPVLYALEATPQ
jgi:hypothetical protein